MSEHIRTVQKERELIKRESSLAGNGIPLTTFLLGRVERGARVQETHREIGGEGGKGRADEERSAAVESWSGRLGNESSNILARLTDAWSASWSASWKTASSRTATGCAPGPA